MIRTIFFVLFALGLLELFLLVKTGQWFGAWFPLLAVVLGFMAGGVTIRHTGIKSLNEIAQAGRTGQASQVGAEAAITGILGFFAGILFILPGLLSDVAAILLLLPFSRRLVAGFVVRNGVRQGRRPTAVVIDGEAVEIIDDRLPPQGKNDNSPWKQ